MAERTYLERTIETVRNHRDADNCWPQWANIFADEIERLWAIVANVEAVITDASVTYSIVDTEKEEVEFVTPMMTETEAIRRALLAERPEESDGRTD